MAQYMASYDGFSSYSHLEHDSETVNEDEQAQETLEREASHAKSLPKDVLPPDVYINGADVDNPTITVQPMKHERIIGDDSQAAKHVEAGRRGRQLQHDAVNRIVHLLDQLTSPARNFEATKRQIDTLDKFSGRCTSTSTRGHSQMQNFGKLPPISQLVYDDRLPRGNQQKVDYDLYMERTHLDRNRAFDCKEGIFGSCR